jgi:hypothetical protein
MQYCMIYRPWLGKFMALLDVPGIRAVRLQPGEGNRDILLAIVNYEAALALKCAGLPGLKSITPLRVA